MYAASELAENLVSRRSGDNGYLHEVVKNEVSYSLEQW